LNAVVARIAALYPVVLRFIPHVRDPGDGFDIFQAELNRRKQTQRSPMIYSQQLSIKVSRQQRLRMARRRQVNRHEIGVGTPVGVEVYRRFEAGPLCRGRGRVGLQQIVEFQPSPPGDRTPTFHTYKTRNLLMDLMAREKSANIERNGKTGGESIESQPPRRNVTGAWGSPVVVILQWRNLRLRIGRH